MYVQWVYIWLYVHPVYIWLYVHELTHKLRFVGWGFGVHLAICTLRVHRACVLRAAEDEEAENKGSVLGDFGVWPGSEVLNQGGNEPLRKEIGPKCRTN